MSLWSVDEMSTTILMDRFYALLSEGLDRGEALQRAQREVQGVTAQQVITWCEAARERVRDVPDAQWRLDRTIADAHFAARQFQSALEIYTRTLASLEPDTPEYRDVRVAISRCRLAVRNPLPADPALNVYDLPYYWAPFVLVGAWQS